MKNKRGDATIPVNHNEQDSSVLLEWVSVLLGGCRNLGSVAQGWVEGPGEPNVGGREAWAL